MHLVLIHNLQLENLILENRDIYSLKNSRIFFRVIEESILQGSSFLNDHMSAESLLREDKVLKFIRDSQSWGSFLRDFRIRTNNPLDINQGLASQSRKSDC